MKFTPVSEQEADAMSANLWPNGDYDFEVREATEKESASGNEMTELEVWIYDASGGRRPYHATGSVLVCFGCDETNDVTGGPG